MQFMTSYHVNRADWPWVGLQVQIRFTKVNVELICDVGNILIRLQYGACNFWGVIVFTNSFDWGLDWKFQKGHTKAIIKPGWNSNMENIPVKLQHSACTYWVVIAFTRPFDVGLDWKFKKVIQRSTSWQKLMWQMLLIVKLQHDASKFWEVMFTKY